MTPGELQRALALALTEALGGDVNVAVVPVGAPAVLAGGPADGRQFMIHPEHPRPTVCLQNDDEDSPIAVYGSPERLPSGVTRYVFDRYDDPATHTHEGEE